MHWSKNKAGPAEDITLNIKVTEPQTSVGLLVIDKSINLLGKGNDITEDAVSFFFFLLFQECIDLNLEALFYCD